MTLSPVERKWPGNGKNGILDFGGYIDMSQKKNYILQKKKEKKKTGKNSKKEKKEKKENIQIHSFKHFCGQAKNLVIFSIQL